MMKFYYDGCAVAAVQPEKRISLWLRVSVVKKIKTKKNRKKRIMSTLKYDEKFPAMVEELAAKGEPDARIASRLGISVASFYNYKQQFPEFAEALVAGRKLCYSRVRAKLLKVAQGHCSVTTEVYKNGELYKTTQHWLPPNLKAIIYFQKHMSVGEVTIKEETPVEEDSKISKSGMRHMGLMRPMGLMESKKGSVEEVSKISSPLRPSSPFSPLNPAEEDSKIYKRGVGGTERSEKPGNTGTADGCPGYSAGRRAED